MINTLAIANYRSLLSLTIPLGRLNLITGANGSGKSNLYRALRLLAETAHGGVVSALAREGGLSSTLWAGPEKITRRMLTGEIPIQGLPRQEPVALKLGFAGDDFGYAIDLGLPPPSDAPTAFEFDPQIKREAIWAGPFLRQANLLVDRRGAMARARDGRQWRVVAEHLNAFESLFTQLADPERAPEAMVMRESIRQWRFYDHFRTDRDAPARMAPLGTRTPVLSHEGGDLAAAWQTIVEIGDTQALNAAVEDAFPGAFVRVDTDGGRFNLRFTQHGLLRPLSAAELSDGTLRYLLWIAALHTPRPPPLMVLNEPETSLHPDLLPALARLIVQASTRSQVWVVSHAGRLIAALKEAAGCNEVALEKNLSQTRVVGLKELEEPAWYWPER
ncbi:AAA family ATPase [Dyella sp. 2RAB6]|uniref:AAA family ATPase n=1 Tax=Dyella sp. 2RAB6 TaxID=3232992 RepID=UPI003F8FD55E